MNSRNKKNKDLKQIYKKSEELELKLDIWDRKIRKTESFNKIWDYVNTLPEEVSFQKEVARFRKKYSLPKKGFPLDKVKGFIKFLHSDKWVAFTEEINKIAEIKYGLYSNWGAHTFRHYVLYNKLEEPEFGTLSQFKIADMTLMFKKYEDYSDQDKKEKDLMSYEEKIEMLKHISKNYPCAIFIGPYAGEREVVDYVKKIWNIGIKPILKEYKNPKVKLGKIRKRNPSKQKRNKFIYENRKLGSKLTSLVAEKFGDLLDYTYILRIIKAEGKKIDVHE